MRGVWDQPLVFVDLETTGGSQFTSRVLEIGLVRVEQGRVVATYQKLLDPGDDVPDFITALTGITTADTRGCPTFRDIAGEVADLMEGAVFVAHNVRFDFGFLKMEFDRLGVEFRPSLLCTVRLSRRLFPQFKSHKLQALIDRHQLIAPSRHRAYDDAHCLWQFFSLCLREFDLDTLEEAMDAQLQLQSIPSQLNREDVDALPEGPGVYIFEASDGAPLYVGKSVNVRKRVLSHFNSEYDRGVEEKLAKQVAHLRGIATHGELSALLVESEMVKSLQPMYNRMLRQRQVMVLALADKDADGYMCVRLIETREISLEDSKRLLAVYATKARALQSLNASCGQYRLCAKLMGVEKTRKGCFLSQLGKCDGACVGRDTYVSYNARFAQAFADRKIASWPFNGPVVITERNAQISGATGFVVRDWCLIGKLIEYEDGSLEQEDLAGSFDLDTYKIIRQFITKPANRSLIRPMVAAAFS